MTTINTTHRTNQIQRYALALLIATLPMLGSCATRWGGGDGTVIDAETKAPMAGVHFLIFVRTSAPSEFPFGRSRHGCGPEFHAVSDAQGKFTIPEDALDQPWQFSLTRVSTSVNVVAYAREYVGGATREGVRQTGYGDVKEGPLNVTVAMSRDTRTRFERKESLSQQTMAGCACGAMHLAMLRELSEIEPGADLEEFVRQRGGMPLQPGEPRPMPRLGHARRTCP